MPLPRNFLALPEHLHHGEINFVVHFKMLSRAQFILESCLRRISKEISNYFERQKEGPVEFDVNRHARLFSAGTYDQV